MWLSLKASKYLTYSMNKYPSWKAESRSASQEIPNLYEARRYTTVSTRARHCHCPKPDESNPVSPPHGHCAFRSPIGSLALTLSSKPSHSLVRPYFSLARLFRNLKQNPCGWLSHRPDDGGSRHLIKSENFCQTARCNNPEESRFMRKFYDNFDSYFETS